jgi:hypothetical protein
MNTTPAAETPRKHHFRSPSTLQVREACAKYTPRQSDSEASRAGTKQHDAFEASLTIGLEAACVLHKLDDAQAEAVTKCHREFAKFYDAYKESKGVAPLVLVEEYLPIDDFILAPGELGTTAGYLDVAIIAPDYSRADIIDLKFGFWPVEPVKTNLQVISYLLGLIHKYPQLRNAPIGGSIFQPYIDPEFKRLDEDYHHTFQPAEYLPLYKRVCNVVARSLNPHVEPVITDGACVFCANVETCPAVAKLVVETSRKYAPLRIPKEINPTLISTYEDIEWGLKLADLMNIWAPAYRTRATKEAIAANKAPDGYKFAKGQRRVIESPEAFRTVALERGVTEEVLRGSVEYHFGPVEKFIEEHTPKGGKKEAVKALGQAWLDAGAVKEGSEYTYLVMVKDKDADK